MLEKLKRRLPDAEDEALLGDLLGEAGAFLRAYTNRAELPEALEDAQVRVAAILYNRIGMEGESSHSEGGVLTGRGRRGLRGDAARGPEALAQRLARGQDAVSFPRVGRGFALSPAARPGIPSAGKGGIADANL